MRAARCSRGWMIDQAARHLGVDPATWGEWERSGQVAWTRYRTRLEDFLKQLLDTSR